jgi:glycosyltransferase involved in cell wall biosynthesis
MKVLFSCPVPFFLAHGGSQTLIESVMRELAGLGIDVEPARWWDENQTGDILHYIGRPATLNVRLAHKKGFKVVMTDLLDQTASRTAPRLFLQRSFIRLLRDTVGKFTGQFSWEVFRELDAIVYAVAHEWGVAKYLFDARPERGHVIPHGLEAEALRKLAEPQAEGDYLVSVATIHPRKNNLMLAEAALLAKIPIVFLGRAYSEGDPYFLRFQEMIDNQYVRYAGFVNDDEKYRYLRGARGFALLSQFESGCIAIFEAAGAGLPLFLSDLPWATRSYPAAREIAFAKPINAQTVAPLLSQFYQTAHRQPGLTFPILTWREVAERYVDIYHSLAHSPGEHPCSETVIR